MLELNKLVLSTIFLFMPCGLIKGDWEERAYRPGLPGTPSDIVIRKLERIIADKAAAEIARKIAERDAMERMGINILPNGQMDPSEPTNRPAAWRNRRRRGPADGNIRIYPPGSRASELMPLRMMARELGEIVWKMIAKEAVMGGELVPGRRLRPRVKRFLMSPASKASHTRVGTMVLIRLLKGILIDLGNDGSGPDYSGRPPARGRYPMMRTPRRRYPLSDPMARRPGMIGRSHPTSWPTRWPKRWPPSRRRKVGRPRPYIDIRRRRYRDTQAAEEISPDENEFSEE